MDSPIVVRERLPILASLSMGLLASGLCFAMYGPVVGAPVALVSALVLWRAVRMGAVVDGRGVTVRRFLPGGDQRMAWSVLRGVALDEVRSGTDEGRSTELRLRFLVEGSPPPQVLGCGAKVAEDILERFAARGLQVTDSRP